MISQVTIDRLEETMVGFYNQCLLPLKFQSKKQPSTPQFQQHPQLFHARDNKSKSINQTLVKDARDLELEVELLKI